MLAIARERVPTFKLLLQFVMNLREGGSPRLKRLILDQAQS